MFLILLPQKVQTLNQKNKQVESLNVKAQPRLQPKMVPGPQGRPPPLTPH